MLPSRIACARIDVHTGTGSGRKSSASLRTTGGRNGVAVASRSTARPSARFSGRNRIRSLERSCCGSSLRAWYVIPLRRPTSLAQRRHGAWNGLRGRYREQRRGISLIIMARRAPALRSSRLFPPPPWSARVRSTLNRRAKGRLGPLRKGKLLRLLPPGVPICARFMKRLAQH